MRVPRCMLRDIARSGQKIEHAGVRRRAELLYQQLDGLQTLRRTLRPELLAESRKHKAAKLLRQIPCIGPIRAARLIALMQTPHRFRSKRQLWTYSGLGIETRDSAQYRFVRGQLQHTKKPQQIRGLNQNHNHEMKEIFKGAAIRICGRCWCKEATHSGSIRGGLRSQALGSEARGAWWKERQNASHRGDREKAGGVAASPVGERRRVRTVAQQQPNDRAA